MVDFSGNVTANAFVGDGSGLTDVKDASFDLTGAVDGDLLRYDATASKWMKVTPDYISNGDTNVGFGTTTPKSSAALEVKSTTKGFLPPRMTENDRDNISTPPAGLQIWCANCGSNGEMQVYNGTDWTNMIGGAAALQPPPQVGDFREGGVVFYIFQNGDPGYVAGETHGLVSAIQDQSTGIPWGSSTTTGATATGIGEGQANTTAIIDNQGTGTYAASVCDNYSVIIGATTYVDWFLPSKDELNEMYKNKATIDATATAGTNGGSGFASASYWSSTEVDDVVAWLQLFLNGDQRNYFGKDSTPRVRTVRAF